MSGSSPNLASFFISADEQVPADEGLVLDESSDEASGCLALASVTSSITEFYAAAAVDAVPSCFENGVVHPHRGVVLDNDDGDTPHDLQQPDANKRRSGGVAGMGGRPEGTGIRTRENFPRGALRVLAESLRLRGVAAVLDHPLLDEVPVEARGAFSSLLDGWRRVPGREEIWAVPYLFGVAARFSVWGKTDYGKRSACCTWVSDDGHVRCTCVGSDVFNADLSAGRESTCEHVDVFVGALSQMVEALNRPSAVIVKWLHAIMSGDSRVRGRLAGDVEEEDGAVWRVHRDIVVVISAQRGTTVPVPVYLPKRGVSCGFCPLASLAGCSHTKQAEQYRTSGGPALAQVTASGCVRSTVSTKPLSLFNCPKAIAFDRNVGDMARLGSTFVLDAPTVCLMCAADMPEPSSETSTPDGTLKGILHSTLGPCSMRVTRRTCPDCGFVGSRDGREDALILLSLTSGCTVVWARKCAESVRCGALISDVISHSLSDWAGLRRAKLLPATAKSRGADTLRALILTLMRLCVIKPDDGLYECTVCCLPDGRYQVITADGICLGFDANSLPFSFEHLCEAAPLVNMRTREGCMVIGEQARRMMRHVLVPNDPAAVTDRTLPSAEKALGCLFPMLLDDEDTEKTGSASGSSIRRLLSLVWKVEAAVLPLAESLLAAYQSTQVKRVKERQRRADCARRLQASITVWRAAHPEAVALMVDAVWNSQADSTADGAAGVAGNISSAGSATGKAPGADTAGQSAAARKGRRSATAKSRPKSKVKPGEEPALHIPKPLLQPYLLSLDENDVDHICRMALAFALDPVIAGIKQRHFDGLTDIVSALRSSKPRSSIEQMVTDATSRPVQRPDRSKAAQCLVELRHIMVALQAAVLVFESAPGFADAIASVLEEAVVCARAFYSDFADDVKANHQYLSRYLDSDFPEDKLLSEFRARYPNAPSEPGATGVFMPGRDQCRAEAYAKGDTTSCGTCEKGFASSDKYSDGALTICCACSHPKILGFVVLDRKESPQVLINALLSRFPRLPRYLVYDFACGVVRCAMVKLPWMLRDLCVVSDRFHVCNHTCSHFFNANSYGELDFKNTLTHEQRNASIRKMEKILRGAGRYGYLALLCYHTSVLNSFADSKTVYQQDSLAAAAAVDARAADGQAPADFDVEAAARNSAKPAVTLPAQFDVRADYFTRHPCRCCGYTVPKEAGRG